MQIYQRFFSDQVQKTQGRTACVRPPTTDVRSHGSALRRSLSISSDLGLRFSPKVDAGRPACRVIKAFFSLMTHRSFHISFKVSKKRRRLVSSSLL